jgi:hypothetical protein
MRFPSDQFHVRDLIRETSERWSRINKVSVGGAWAQRIDGYKYKAERLYTVDHPPFFASTIPYPLLLGLCLGVGV